MEGDNGYDMTWRGKKLTFDVAALQGPPDMDIGPLLQASTAVEEEMMRCLEQGHTMAGVSRPTSPEPHPPSAPPAPSSAAHHVDNAQGAPPLKRRKQNSNNVRRKFRRLDEVLKSGQVARPEVFRNFVLNSTPKPTNLDFAKLPVKRGAYSAGTFKMPNADEVMTVEKALEMGLQYVPWDGVDPVPYFDAKSRLACVLAGRPKDATFLAAGDGAFDRLEAEGKAAPFRKTQLEHPRGSFPAVNVGVTHGIGTLQPVNLQNGELSGVVDRLLADENIQRLATFASASFALWSPKVYTYYKDHLDPLFEKMPELRKIFPKSVFPAAAFNFGPDVWTFKHRDVMNCPFGFCAIQALGRFDPKKGGHIILWELGLIIEFPPGSLILIPSATITHSNVPVAQGDVRASFTQFAAGALFRYVDCGFCTEAELQVKDRQRYLEICGAKPHRWQAGLDLLTRVEDLWPGTL